MKMLADDAGKIVKIWLTNEEQQDDLLMEMIRSHCQAYTKQKYKAAVFFSGGKDLFYQTEGLLLHNRTAAARHAVVEQLH